jgi:putative aldouronate transport system substrate-binding protein
MFRWKKYLIAVIIVTFSFVLYGCKKDDSMGYIDDHKYPETLNLTLLSRDIYHTDGQAITRDSVVKYFEEKFNVKFEFIQVPGGQEEVFSKMNRMLSIGDIPDLMEMRTDLPLANNLYESLINADKIVDVNEFIEGKEEQYPNIHAITQSDEANSSSYLSEDGKLSMIPRYFGTVDHGFIIRKDWLDQYNLDVPETHEDLIEVLEVFVENDPGGVQNLGLTLPNTWWFGHIYAGFTGANNWSVEGDAFKYALTSDGQRDAYRFLNNLYENNLLDKDVFTSVDESDAIAKFSSGQSGVTMMGVTYGAPIILKQLKNANEDAELVYVNLSGPEGPMRLYLSEYFEGVAISKEFKDIPRLFDMIEYILSDEGQKILNYGLEGKHYSLDANGEMVVSEDQAKLRDKEGWSGRSHGLRAMFDVSQVMNEQFSEDYQKMEQFITQLNQEGATVRDPLFGVKTQAEVEVGSAPWDHAGEYTIGFVSGTYDIEDNDVWQYDFVETFYAKGMSRIENEINELYDPEQ